MITVQSFEVNYFGENTYLLYDETKEAVLIDCGCMRPMEKQRLSDYIREKGLSLKRNLCTHLHLDHIFGNEYIEQTYGIGPEASQADEALPSAEEQSKAFGLPVAVKDVPFTLRTTVSLWWATRFLWGASDARTSGAEVRKPWFRLSAGNC